MREGRDVPDPPSEHDLRFWAQRFDGESGSDFAPYLMGTRSFAECALAVMEERALGDKPETVKAKAAAFDELHARMKEGDDPIDALLDQLGELGIDQDPVVGVTIEEREAAEHRAAHKIKAPRKRRRR